MHEEEKVQVNQSKTFPWGALAIYLAVFLGTTAYEAIVGTSLGTDIETDILLAGGVIGIIFSVVGAMIGAAIQYVFVKFPTQWIAKDNFVYKYDIWSAIFYSGAIGYVLNFIARQLGSAGNIFISIAVSVVTTALFLFFYFSGQEKEKHVKRAITIVQVAWLVLGAILLIASQTLINNIPV